MLGPGSCVVSDACHADAWKLEAARTVCRTRNTRGCTGICFRGPDTNTFLELLITARRHPRPLPLNMSAHSFEDCLCRCVICSPAGLQSPRQKAATEPSTLCGFIAQKCITRVGPRPLPSQVPNSLPPPHNPHQLPHWPLYVLRYWGSVTN